MSLADEIEAGGGTDEAVALALGWHRQLVLEDRTPEDCDRAEHISHTETPWWHGPGGERRHLLPPAFRDSIDALAAECKRRNWTWRKERTPEGFAMLVRSVGGEWGVAACKGDGTPEEDARALCAALIRAVESEARDGR